MPFFYNMRTDKRFVPSAYYIECAWEFSCVFSILSADKGAARDGFYASIDIGRLLRCVKHFNAVPERI